MNLVALPSEFATTRDALHQIAYFAIAPKRYEQTGRLGLRAQPGVFGTPAWGDGDQVWVDGTELVHRSAGRKRRTPITTVRAAAEWLHIEYREVWFETFHDPLAAVDPDAPLTLDVPSVHALAAWFDFGTAVLEDLAATPGAVAPTEVQLWPEHFDPALELGDAEAGTKASYGASPGDPQHPQPYLYVSPWTKADRPDPYWNDATFAGASLSYTQLLAAPDPRDAAVAFLRRGAELLTG